MKGIRLSTVVTVVAALATGMLLFTTSQKVQKAERHLAKLESEKEQTEEAIRVLRAEWDYLNRPDRLETMATRYLGMKQPVLAEVTKDAAALPAPASPASGQLVVQPALYHPAKGHPQ